MTAVLDEFGHHESRHWVRTQIRAMNDLDAVTITETGNIMIAQITRLGIDHVERRSIIDGISRPSPEV